MTVVLGEGAGGGKGGSRGAICASAHHAPPEQFSNKKNNTLL